MAGSNIGHSVVWYVTVGLIRNPRGAGWQFTSEFKMNTIQGIRCLTVVFLCAVVCLQCVQSQLEWCGMPQPLCMCDVHQGIVLCTRRDIVSVPQFSRAIRRRSRKITFHNTGIYSLLQMGSDWPLLKQIELLGNKHLVCGKVQKDVVQLKFMHISITGDCTEIMVGETDEVVSSVGPNQKFVGTTTSIPVSGTVETYSMYTTDSPGNTHLINVSQRKTTGNVEMVSVSQGKLVENRPTELAMSTKMLTVYIKPSVGTLSSQTQVPGEWNMTGYQVASEDTQEYDRNIARNAISQVPEDGYVVSGARGVNVQLVVGVLSGVLILMTVFAGMCVCIMYRRGCPSLGPSRRGRRDRRMHVEMQQLFLNEAFQDTTV